MADREGATDQRQSDILANIQQVILNSTLWFETDDVADSGVLMELRQCLRDLQILHTDPGNARQREAVITTLIDQIEMRILTDHGQIRLLHSE